MDNSAPSSYQIYLCYAILLLYYACVSVAFKVFRSSIVQPKYREEYYLRKKDDWPFKINIDQTRDVYDQTNWREREILIGRNIWC